MMLGLVKLMRRLSLAGDQKEFWPSFEIHSIIGSGPISKKTGCDRSWPSYLHFCNQHMGIEDLPIAPPGQIAQ